MLIRYLTAFSLSLFTTFTICAAEDDDRGRLPDGRAFRTDAQGNEIVDYIAELELAVEGLQRRVNGLEDEVKAKQAQLERVQVGKPPAPQLVEKDLGARTAVLPPASQNAANCDQYVKQVKYYSQLLEDKKLDSDVLRQRHGEELEKAKGDVRRLEAALREKSEENESMQAKLTGAEKQVAALREEGESVKTQLAARKAEAEAPAKVALAVPERREAEAAPPERVPVRITSDIVMKNRSLAVQSLQDRMLKDISSLEGLMAARNTMYQKYVRKAGSSEIKPIDINASRRKIESYRRQVQAASMVHELAGIRGDINEFRGEIQQEIALMRRVVR